MLIAHNMERVTYNKNFCYKLLCVMCYEVKFLIVNLCLNYSKFKKKMHYYSIFGRYCKASAIWQAKILGELLKSAIVRANFSIRK